MRLDIAIEHGDTLTIRAGVGQNPAAGQELVVAQTLVELVFPVAMVALVHRQTARDATPRVLDRLVNGRAVIAAMAILHIPNLLTDLLQMRRRHGVRSPRPNQAKKEKSNTISRRHVMNFPRDIEQHSTAKHKMQTAVKG